MKPKPASQKVPAYAGTINTMLLHQPAVDAAALARVVVTMTEGKSAALQRLAVPSKLHVDLATGTGTDQYCIAAPLAERPPLTSASPHMKLGELVGLATREATMEALRWQNGLEASYTRGVFHALGRYGVREATFFDDIAPFLGRGGSRAAEEEHEGGHSMSRSSGQRRTRSPRSAIASATEPFRMRSPPERWCSRRRALAANLAAQVHRWARVPLAAAATRRTAT